MADACAPSKAALADSTKDLISKLLAAGYVVVAPDYEGLGTPGIHPFLNVKSEAFQLPMQWLQRVTIYLNVIY